MISLGEPYTLVPIGLIVSAGRARAFAAAADVFRKVSVMMIAAFPLPLLRLPLAAAHAVFVMLSVTAGLSLLSARLACASYTLCLLSAKPRETRLSPPSLPRLSLDVPSNNTLL